MDQIGLIRERNNQMLNQLIACHSKFRQEQEQFRLLRSQQQQKQPQLSETNLEMKEGQSLTQFQFSSKQ